MSEVGQTLQHLRRENKELHFTNEQRMVELSTGIEKLRIDIRKSCQEPKTKRHELADLSNSLGSLHEIISSSEKYKEQAILASLNYDRRMSRHESIMDAHRDTFKWIYGATVSGFSSWLGTQDGVFWISGKPGSGKSTLMKYIAHSQETRQVLAEWAGSEGVTLLSHYFWSAGTSMQKSKQGLLQSLLHDIFREYPSYIRIMCPERWAGTKIGPAPRAEAWSISEMLVAFETIIDQESLTAKFCIFIDGLDEYDGEFSGLCDMVKRISKSSNIKICISSRPLNAFENAFGQESSQKLYVHTLTSNDILRFAQDRLQSHCRWAACAFDDAQKLALIKDLGSRSEGVFLWVFLVTEELRRGLDNDDNIRHLQRRLEKLPRDLERLFSHILSTVEEFYHNEMADILQIALHPRAPLLVSIYGYHLQQYYDEADGLRGPVEVLTVKARSELLNRTGVQINARTNGLLEKRGVSVEFLHRTVRDYLLTRDMCDFLAAKSTPSFDVNYAISRAYVIDIKSTAFPSGFSRISDAEYQGLVVEIIKKTLSYASDAADCTTDLVFELLDELESTLVDMSSEWQAPCPRRMFRDLVIQSNLPAYVSMKLLEPGYRDLSPVSPLYIASKASRYTPSTIKLLLQHGELPNQPEDEQVMFTPWLSFMGEVSPWGSRLRGRSLLVALECGLFSIFLVHGADPDGQLSVTDGHSLTAFAAYLQLSFSTHVSETSPETYLHSLSSFLERNPDFSACVKLDEHFYHLKPRRNSYQWWPDPGETSTVLRAFCDGLSNVRLMTTPDGMIRSRRLKLLSRVVEMIISEGVKRNWDLELLRSTSLKVFPEYMAKRVLGNSDKTGDVSIEPVARKRFREDEEDVNNGIRRGKRFGC